MQRGIHRAMVVFWGLGISLLFSGCLSAKHSGTLIYDLGEKNEVAFFPCRKWTHQFIQSDPVKRSFWMTEPSDDRMDICERDFDGRVRQRFNAGFRLYGCALSLSPSQEKILYFDTETIPKHGDPDSKWETLGWMKLKVGVPGNFSTKTLSTRYEQTVSPKKTMFWLSEDEFITVVNEIDNRLRKTSWASPCPSVILKTNVKKDVTEIFQCDIDRLFLGSIILPSPNQQVLLVKLPGRKIGLFDIASMTLVQKFTAISPVQPDLGDPTGFTWINDEEFAVWFYSKPGIQFNITTLQSTPLEVSFPLKDYHIVEATARFLVIKDKKKNSLWCYDRKTQQQTQICPSNIGSVYKLTENRILIEGAISGK